MPKPWSSLAFLTRRICPSLGRAPGTRCTYLGREPWQSAPLATGPALATIAVAGSTHGARAWGRASEGQMAASSTPTTHMPRPERFSPLLPPPLQPARAAAACPAHRDSVLERDALQRVARADPVLHKALHHAGAQRRPHAGGAAVRAGLGAGQAQRQLGLLRLGARARARRGRGGRGSGRTGAAFPEQGQRGRGIRHGSCGGRQVGKRAKRAVPPPLPPPPLLPPH